jgi:hypothetical protein
MKLAWLLSFALFFSCKPDSKSSYAIKDFPGELQPELRRIAVRGYVTEEDGDTLARVATAEALRRLEHSEHPLLRAAACRALLRRKDVDHFDMIMHHLDDTARIAYDCGEFGIRFILVTDDLLFTARWKTEADRGKTTDSVLMRHDYLEAAYFACDRVGARKEYYPFIKEMALRESRFIFERRESALFGLARFGKKEDIPLIRDILLSKCGRLGYTSFRLMKEFPDTAYGEVFTTIYPRRFYSRLYKEEDREAMEEFIQAVAAYRSAGSAKILGAIYYRKPFAPRPGDSVYFRDAVIQAIWDNPCEAYATLRKQLKAVKKEWDKWHLLVPFDPGDSAKAINQRDSSGEPIRWW